MGKGVLEVEGGGLMNGGALLSSLLLLSSLVAMPHFVGRAAVNPKSPVQPSPLYRFSVTVSIQQKEEKRLYM